MSPYELGREGNASRGSGSHFPRSPIPAVGKGTLDLGGSTAQRGERTLCRSLSRSHEVGRAFGQTVEVGAHTNQRLSPRHTGKGRRGKAKLPNRTLRNSAVRDYWGASGNVVMAGMCTHLATERLRLVTPRLKLARPSSIPTSESLAANFRHYWFQSVHAPLKS
jgi:hypothetical protein